MLLSYYEVLTNRVGRFCVRIFTEVVSTDRTQRYFYSHTYQQSSVDKIFIIRPKKKTTFGYVNGSYPLTILQSRALSRMCSGEQRALENPGTEFFRI